MVYPLMVLCMATMQIQNAINDYLRSIFSLPARLGGLGLANPIVDSSRQFSDSAYILSPQSNPG